MKHWITGIVVTGATALCIAALGSAQGGGKVIMQDIHWSPNSNAIVELTARNGSRHIAGAQFLMGDGSVRFVRGSTSSATFAGQTVRLRFAAAENRGKLETANNLKQISLGAHTWAEVKVILVKMEAGGKLKATHELTFKDARTQPAQNKDHKNWINVESVSAPIFRNASHYIGTANGGVWKTASGG